MLGTLVKISILYCIYNIFHVLIVLCCQGVTVNTVTSVTTNYTHQSSRALYQRTALEQSLSALKHSILTHLTLLPFVYSLVVPVFHSQISTTPVLHRLQAQLLPLVPLDKVKD